MQEIDLHDLFDVVDYAASQQQGSVSLTRCGSSKRSTSSEPEGAEVVYSKDNVTIQPTQFASERISGRLKLIKQGDTLFMTWIPYKGPNSNARLSEKDRNLYTIRAVPFTEIWSIRRHTPPFGWQYLTIVLSSELAFPPLYFYNGGVRKFLATIKPHVFLVWPLIGGLVRFLKGPIVMLRDEYPKLVRWYQIKITMRWEDDGNGDSSVTPARVVQYEGLFPFAFDIVASEDKDNWTWFMEQLVQVVGNDRTCTCAHGVVDVVKSGRAFYSFIKPYFFLTSYMSGYAHAIGPVSTMRRPTSSALTAIIRPPITKKPVDRPRK